MYAELKGLSSTDEDMENFVPDDARVLAFGARRYSTRGVRKVEICSISVFARRNGWLFRFERDVERMRRLAVACLLSANTTTAGSSFCCEGMQNAAQVNLGWRFLTS